MNINDQPNQDSQFLLSCNIYKAKYKDTQAHLSFDAGDLSLMLVMD